MSENEKVAHYQQAADAFEQFSPLPPLRGQVASIADEIAEYVWLESRARAVLDEAYKQRDSEMMRIVQENIVWLSGKRKDSEHKLLLARRKPKAVPGAMARPIGERLRDASAVSHGDKLLGAFPTDGEATREARKLAGAGKRVVVEQRDFGYGVWERA